MQQKRKKLTGFNNFQEKTTMSFSEKFKDTVVNRAHAFVHCPFKNTFLFLIENLPSNSWNRRKVKVVTKKKYGVGAEKPEKI